MLLQLVTSDQKLGYIVDGATPLVNQLAVEQSFVAHSPDDSKYNKYLNIKGAVSAPLFMPLWDEEELDIVRIKQYEDISKEQVCLIYN